MSTAAMDRVEVRRPLRWLAAISCAVAALDLLLAVAAAMETVTAVHAAALHLALTMGFAAAMSAPVWRSFEDVAMLAVLGLLFAGPVGLLSAMTLLIARPSDAATEQARQRDDHNEQDAIETLVAELRGGRALSPDAPLPRSLPTLLAGGSVADQLAVLKVIALNYEPDHRELLTRALRAEAGGVRAQAAALVTSLSARYRQRCDQALAALRSGARPPQAAIAEIETCLRSGLLETGYASAARDAAIGACHDALRVAQERGEPVAAMSALLTEVEQAPSRSPAALKTAFAAREVPC